MTRILEKLRTEVSAIAGSLAADIADRLYLGDLLEEDNVHPVYIAASRHMNRLPVWRLWLAAKALGRRPFGEPGVVERSVAP